MKSLFSVNFKIQWQLYVPPCCRSHVPPVNVGVYVEKSLEVKSIPCVCNTMIMVYDIYITRLETPADNSLL